MPHLRLVELAEAAGELKREYEAAAGRSGGKVFNIVKAMSLRPRVLKASIARYREIMFGESPLTRVERELLSSRASAGSASTPPR